MFVCSPPSTFSCFCFFLIYQLSGEFPGDYEDWSVLGDKCLLGQRSMFEGDRRKRREEGERQEGEREEGKEVKEINIRLQ